MELLNLTATFWERHMGSLTPLASNARAHKSGIVGRRWKRLATNWFQQQKGESRCRDHGRSIESVRVKGGPTGESNRCDPNATRPGKRPLSARYLQRKQTTLKSTNIMCVCETPGLRSRTDASLLNFPMWRRNSLTHQAPRSRAESCGGAPAGFRGPGGPPPSIAKDREVNGIVGEGLGVAIACAAGSALRGSAMGSNWSRLLPNLPSSAG